MGYRLLLLLGWLWPSLVAAVGVAAIAAGQPLRSHVAWTLLLFAALLGSPAVFTSLGHRMPKDWHPQLRDGVSALLTAAVLVVELYVAMGILAYSANVAGPGLIE